MDIVFSGEDFEMVFEPHTHQCLESFLAALSTCLLPDRRWAALSRLGWAGLGWAGLGLPGLGWAGLLGYLK